MAVASREELHRLIEALSDSELHAAKSLLESLQLANRDPFMRALEEAPEDDEPSSPEEEAVVQEARQQLERGEVISDDELWHRLGHAPRG